MPRPPVPYAARANLLLTNLLAEDGGALTSAIRSEHPAQGQVLSTRAAPATEIWFPVTGVIGLSITDDEGRSAQTGMVGPEGSVGLEILFSGMPALA
ncbi:MAG: hypothetical protein QOG73_2261, partial [Acetobacteraceae bacterium]|nr:hypothetical protein [Acetobacteraceae bacterium]